MRTQPSSDFDLPWSLQEISRVLGREQTLRLADALPHGGGRRKWRRGLYVPTLRRMKPDHLLVRVLGEDGARLMSKKFGGLNLCLAKARDVRQEARNRRIVEMSTAGTAPAEIARDAGISVVSVNRIIRESKGRRNSAG